MNKLLTMVGLVAVLALGCDSAPTVSDGGSATETTLASILPECKATATYGVTGMTWGGWDTAVEQLLEKLPGVASADADKTTRSVTIIYDKSVFDTSSIGDEGRYKFELRQDSAAEEKAAGASESSNEEQASDETEAPSSSMIKIEDAAAEGSESGDDNFMPSLDGPSS